MKATRTQIDRDICFTCDYRVEVEGEDYFAWYCTNAHCGRYRDRIKNYESCFHHERGGMKTGGNVLGVQRAMH